MSFFDLEKFAERLAVVTPENSYTYEHLKRLTQDFISFIEPHHLIFLLVHNNIESLVGYVASLNNSSPALPINSECDDQQLNHLIEIYKPRYIWKPYSRLLLKEKVLFSFGSYVLVETQFIDLSPLPVNLSLLLSTSGSTGSPKLVRLSQQNLRSNALSIIEYLGITEKEKPITSLPLYYSFGLSVINSHLLTGATILLTDFSYIQGSFWNFAKENHFTSFSGVPYTFEILKKLRFFSLNLPSLKTITQAGGKLNNDLLKFFIENCEDRGIRFFTMYGQTEATARMSYLQPEYGLSKLGSIGKAIPGGSFYVLDDEKNKLSEGCVGELIYEGPNVGLGYAENRKDLYKEDENKGVLFTGDLGYCDNEGFYFITGRKKRFLKLFGNRISLDYLEYLLKDILNEAVCSGNDNNLIVWTTDISKEDNEIINFLAEKTKIIRTAFIIKHIDKIPRSQTGKILYANLT